MSWFKKARQPSSAIRIESAANVIPAAGDAQCVSITINHVNLVDNSQYYVRASAAAAALRAAFSLQCPTIIVSQAAAPALHCL